jgi:hypothetical protein
LVFVHIREDFSEFYARSGENLLFFSGIPNECGGIVGKSELWKAYFLILPKSLKKR